jgi:hypothetical protein
MLWRPVSARSANLLLMSGMVASGSSGAQEGSPVPRHGPFFGRLEVPTVT